MIKAILWDLDGTIINSEEGITKCVQYALRAHGIEEPDLTKLQCFIGPPLGRMYREKYHMSEEEAWQAERTAPDLPVLYMPILVILSAERLQDSCRGPEEVSITVRFSRVILSVIPLMAKPVRM